LALVGTASGVHRRALGALFATGGPPFVIYLSHRLRATFFGLFLVEGSMRLFSLALAGLFLQENIDVALLMGLSTMAAGTFVGHQVHLSLSRRQVLLIIGLLLIGSGGSLLWRAV
jgi:hypothetical protein